MQLNRGFEREYKERHNPIWPELETVLKQHGVLSYSIFLNPQTRQLFGYAEIEDEERWSAIAQTPECRRWWEYMSDIMETNPDKSPAAMEIREVFHIEKERD